MHGTASSIHPSPCVLRKARFHWSMSAGKPQAAQSLNCDEDETKRYLHNLNDANKLFSSEKANPSRTSNHANIMNLSLREGNVSKVVKTAVVDLTFMPTAGNGPCVIAACDKQGQVCVTPVLSRVTRRHALCIQAVRNFSLPSPSQHLRHSGCRCHMNARACLMVAVDFTPWGERFQRPQGRQMF